MNKVILIFPVLFILCGFVGATNGNIFNSGENITILSKCFYPNNSACSNDCASSILILYPNNSIFSNASMNLQNDSLFNYTVSDLIDGDWPFSIVCSSTSSYLGTSNGFFNVADGKITVQYSSGSSYAVPDINALKSELFNTTWSQLLDQIKKIRYYFLLGILAFVALLIAYKNRKKRKMRSLAKEVSKIQKELNI